MQNDVFAAIADPTRRQILVILAKQRMPVQTLTQRFSVSRPAISKHLRILREAGLVDEHKVGRQRLYQTRLEQLAIVREWVAYFDQFWGERLQVLKTLIEENPDANNPSN
jgi:DNA-binding transcriptional ArsR family regulator